MRVLGIESSCDDTGVAVFDSDEGLLVDLRASQVETHQPYGGVVPELAARDHIRVLPGLVHAALERAGLTREDIGAVAYTAGPGLVGALLVGATYGRSFAWARGIPAVGVHHMEGHLLSPLLESPQLRAPFIALLVSGGHTLLVDVAQMGSYRLLGQSLDDAVGEAFDKTAKLLGLSYPGGPAIAAAASRGDSTRHRFPRPMTDRPGLDFSFSGLKTHVMTVAASQTLDTRAVADIAAAFQDAAVDTLVIKVRRAIQQTGAKRLVVAGGVGANQLLRERLAAMASTTGVEVFHPAVGLCTDNGAMIAYAGWHRIARGESESTDFDVRARWSLEEL